MESFLKELEDSIYLENIKENYLNTETSQLDKTTEKVTEEWAVFLRFKKQSDRTLDKIFRKLEDLKLSPDVFDLSKKYFYETISHQNNHRKKFRISIMCACVYLALCKTKNYQDLDIIKEFFSSSNEKYTAAVKMVKLAVPEVRSLKESYETQICKICNILEISPEINVIKDFMKEYLITDFGKSLLNIKRLKPKHIFFITIYPWLIINKRNIVSPSKYCNLTGISKTLVIESICNSKKLKDFLYENNKIYIENFIKKTNIYNLHELINISDDIMKIFSKNLKTFPR
jgi:hypothetical protein